MGSVEDKGEGEKGLHSLRSWWRPAWHSPLYYEKDQAKIYYNCRASTQERNEAVCCWLDLSDEAHRPKNKEWTKSISVCIYVCIDRTHTCTLNLPIWLLFCPFTQPKSLQVSDTCQGSQCSELAAAPPQECQKPVPVQRAKTVPGL